MADIIVLNENTVKSKKTLDALKEQVSRDFYIPAVLSSSSEERFHCFCKTSSLDMSEIHSGFRTSVRRLKVGSRRILLGLVHGVDIRNYGPDERQSFAQSLASEMRLVKDQQKTNKLVMLGDFNMNPYDKGMTLAAGLNAMMTKSCVAPGVRKHINEEYEFYYNPMWNLFGDETAGPPGTVYDSSSQGAYGWSMLDQVLINHSIVPLFHNVQILDKAGELSLTDARGRPDSKKASDHFPILVSLRRDNHE